MKLKTIIFLAFLSAAILGCNENAPYPQISGHRGANFIAPENFFEEVLHEGKRVPRFQPVSEEVALKEIE